MLRQMAHVLPYRVMVVPLGATPQQIPLAMPIITEISIFPIDIPRPVIYNAYYPTAKL